MAIATPLTVRLEPVTTLSRGSSPISSNGSPGIKWNDAVLPGAAKAFCDVQAANTAEIFVRHVLTDLQPRDVDSNTTLKSLSDYFVKAVETQIQLKSAGDGSLSFSTTPLQERLELISSNQNADNARVLEDPSENLDHVNSHEYLAANSTNSTNHEEYLNSNGFDDSLPKYKNIFRRFSLMGLAKGRGFSVFHKQHSDEVELSHSNGDTYLVSGMSGTNNGERRKMKLSKIVVEVIKEGLVNFSSGGDSGIYDGKPLWHKGRLSLVRAAGGYMIELYSPPKASKPKAGMLCLLVAEARETSALEMPDHENTFVLKADGIGMSAANQEYVIEVTDGDDLKAWLLAIQSCMQPQGITLDEFAERRSRLGGMPESQSLQFFRRDPMSLNLGANSSPSQRRGLPGSSADTLSHNGTGNGTTQVMSHHGASNGGDQAPLSSITSSNSSNNNLSNRGPLSLGYDDVPEVVLQLVDYPWFHGNLCRADAAQLVLNASLRRTSTNNTSEPISGDPGNPPNSSSHPNHGLFLVRQSETRRGEFVLTFNYQRRAKHLRLILNTDGQCRVQHMWFNSIFDCLEHFRVQAIPLESGANSDVKLGDFVVCVAERGQTSNSSMSGHVNAMGRVITHNGPIRTLSQSLDIFRTDGSRRAKENAYSFV
eukprot:TCALIF_04490-PA protein Name:"Similar to Sh2b2 SH2B adapter protein 2 (Rattus norvegicus)" AED:0.24 eAED:0.24 QI:138/0.75/0.8/1/1/1/5/102/651